MRRERRGGVWEEYDGRVGRSGAGSGRGGKEVGGGG